MASAMTGGSGHDSPPPGGAGDEDAALIPKARRRTHRKSRLGCAFCKRRRIKCDERRPSCTNCVMRSLVCSFTTLSPDGGSLISPTASAASPGGDPLHPHRGSSTLSPPQWGDRHHLPSPSATTASFGSPSLGFSTTTLPPLLPPLASVAGPSSSSSSGLPPSLDLVDLELFHHFCTFTAVTLGSTKTIQQFWAVKAPQTAFRHPVVLHAIIGFAGVDMARLNRSSDPARAAVLRAKVDEHWDRALRLATPLLAEIDAENSAPLYVYTSLTCVYIFARGPQPGSFLWFDAADEGSMADQRAGDDGGGGRSSGSSRPASQQRSKDPSSSDEWLTFFRGLRFVNRTVERALRARNKGAPEKQTAVEEQARSLLDQMFGPDVDPEGVDDVMRPTREIVAAGGGVMAVATEDKLVSPATTMRDGGGAGDATSPAAASSGASKSATDTPTIRPGGALIVTADNENLGGPLVDRREPMRDLRDVIRTATRAGDVDRAVYAGALAELAARYVTVFDADGEPRHRSAVVIFGWMYHVSDEFVALVRARRPVALAIFAYFVVLLRVLEPSWFIQRWPEHLIEGIWEALAPAERLWIQWPMERIGWLPLVDE